MVHLHDTRNHETLSQGIHPPDGLAIDWIADNLYWTDGVRNVIEVATLRGFFRKIIIKTNLQEPRAIAVFPQRG